MRTICSASFRSCRQTDFTATIFRSGPTTRIGDFGTTTGRRLFSGLHLGGQIRVAALRYFRAVIRCIKLSSIALGKDSLSARPTMKICRQRPSCASTNSSTAMRPPRRAVTTSDQSPAFNTVADAVVAGELSGVDQSLQRSLTHDWGRNWASEFSVHQTTFWANGDNNSTSTGYTSYGQGVERHDRVPFQ